MPSTSQRRTEILEYIQQHGKGEVTYFTEQYAVSAVTIRNDLNYLEKKGCVTRCYGGATLNNQFTFDRPLNDKKQLNREMKSLLGKRAAQLVEDGDTIIIDSGSTTEQVALNLQGKKNLIVMTNGINVAYQLANQPDVEVMVTGGQMRENSYSLHGGCGESLLNHYRFSKLFLGVDGFDKHAGITTPHSGEAAINRNMIKVAQQVIAVTDSSKFDRQSYCLIAKADEIDVLVTDSGIPDDYVEQLTQLGVEIIIVD